MSFTRKYFDNQYVTRDDRNKFIAKELNDYIGQQVLNIGGGEATFEKIFRCQY